MTEQFYIRPYQSKDKASVIALWEIVFPEEPPWNEPPWNEPENTIRRKLKVQQELFLVAIHGSKLRHNWWAQYRSDSTACAAGYTRLLSSTFTKKLGMQSRIE